MNRVIASFILLVSVEILADEQVSAGRIPEEYEAIGGHALGLGNGGAVALPEVSSVRANPAMLAMQKQYTMTGGYHWPTSGRDFYQVGVVDSKTSPIAAGLNYTGFLENYKDFIETRGQSFDSSIDSRLSVGLAKVVEKLSVGVSAGMVSAFKRVDGKIVKVKGTTFGLGVAGLMTKWLRFGVSAENLSNRSVENYAPKTYRVGAALMSFGGNFTMHLDLRRRERVQGFEFDIDNRLYSSSSGTVDTIEEKRAPEDSAVASFSVRVYDLVRLLGSYTQILESDRSAVSGGVALVQDEYSLSYNVSNSNLAQSGIHSNVNVNVSVAF